MLFQTPVVLPKVFRRQVIVPSSCVLFISRSLHLVILPLLLFCLLFNSFAEYGFFWVTLSPLVFYRVHLDIRVVLKDPQGFLGFVCLFLWTPSFEGNWVSLMGFSFTAGDGMDCNTPYQAQELKITTLANPGIQRNFLPPRPVQS